MARAGALAVLLVVASCDFGHSTPRLPSLQAGATVLAFGDSLTFGTGTTADNSYPQILSGLIGRRVVRSGVPGEVTAAGRQRLRLELSRHQPALVILCHGGNDILRRLPEVETEANLRAMIAEVQAYGADIMLVGVPRPGLFMSEGAPLYQRIADELGLPYLDTTIAEILKDDALKSDTVHPNAAGYRKLAEDVAALLRRAGAV